MDKIGILVLHCICRYRVTEKIPFDAMPNDKISNATKYLKLPNNTYCEYTFHVRIVHKFSSYSKIKNACTKKLFSLNAYTPFKF